MVLQNDFHPFRRLPNQPFTAGRMRSMLVDSSSRHELVPLPTLQRRHRRRSSSCIAIPNLNTIMEEECGFGGFGDEIETLFE